MYIYGVVELKRRVDKRRGNKMMIKKNNTFRRRLFPPLPSRLSPAGLEMEKRMRCVQIK